jgi:hypothetical protein
MTAHMLQLSLSSILWHNGNKHGQSEREKDGE